MTRDYEDWPWDREDEIEFTRRLELAGARMVLEDAHYVMLAELVARGDVDITDDGRLAATSDRTRFVLDALDMEAHPERWDELLG